MNIIYNIRWKAAQWPHISTTVGGNPALALCVCRSHVLPMFGRFLQLCQFPPAVQGHATNISKLLKVSVFVL